MLFWGSLMKLKKISHRKLTNFVWAILGFFLAFLALFFQVPGFSQQPVTIYLLVRALEAQQLQPLAQQFNQQHPEIQLELIEAPNDTNRVEDLYTASFLLGNSPYDLVFMDIVWTPKFAAAGWLKDLSGYLSPEELEQFLPGDAQGGMYQGKLYRAPFRSDAGMLYYRHDLLEKAGYDPPETFDQLITISQDLQQQGLSEWGYVWQGKQYEGLSAMFVEILQGNGAFWVNPETLEVGLDQENAIAAVKFLQQTLTTKISPPGVTTYAEEETRRLFQNGKTAFLRNWPYVYGLALDSPIAGKYSIKPMVHAENQPSGACQGGWGFGISATSKNPDAAWEVIQFFMKQESQKQFVLANGYVPSLKSLFNDPEIVAKYSHYPELLTVLESPALRPPIPQYAQASDILQRYLSAAITNTMSPEIAMKKAAAETRNLLAVSK